MDPNMQEHNKIKARVNWKHIGTGSEGKGKIIEYDSVEQVKSICEEMNQLSDGSYIHSIEYI
jgi:hypothetical protein